MKKFLKLFVAITTICVMLTACNSKTNVNNNNNNNSNVINNNNVNNQTSQTNQNEKVPEDENVITNPVNENFEMSTALTAMDAVVADTNLTKLSDSEIKEKYNFGKYEGLEKLVASNETEDGVSEIAMVKLGDMEQSSDILLMFIDRINDLKEKYADNPEMIKLLTTQDSYIIKQQAGVAVMIIGDSAKEIEAEFDKNFK